MFHLCFLQLERAAAPLRSMWNTQRYPLNKFRFESELVLLGYRLLEDKMEDVPMPARSASSSFLNQQRKGSTLLRFTAHIVTAVFEHVLMPQDLNALQRSARYGDEGTKSFAYCFNA